MYKAPTPLGDAELSCVIRNLAMPVSGSSVPDEQYVPVDETQLVHGETIYTGWFSRQLENHGPSGSHERTVCMPRGKLTETTYTGSSS